LKIDFIKSQLDFKNYLNFYNFSDDLVNDVVLSYSQNWRYYHNINHIYNMINILSPIKSKFTNWTLILWSTLYHDYIYIPENSNNEERSANIACIKMEEYNYSFNDKEFVKSIILATKTHKIVDCDEIKLFLDADLSILGEPRELYESYKNNIRKEYSVFDDNQYKIGRLNILKYFLDMDFIYKTEYFRELFEKQAKNNINYEILTLK